MGPSSFFPYPGASPASAAELLFLPWRSDEDWAKILAHTETRRFTRGQVVMQAGAADRALLIVAEGYLEVLIPRRGGGALRRIATVEPGSIIGEVAFLDAGPRSATVRALTDGATLRLSFAAFEQLAARAPTLGQAILFDLGRILATRLRQRTALLSEWIA